MVGSSESFICKPIKANRHLYMRSLSSIIQVQRLPSSQWPICSPRLLPQPQQGLHALHINVSRKCHIGATLGCICLIDADSIDPKVRSPVLLSHRRASMQFCVIPSVAPLHQEGA